MVLKVVIPPAVEPVGREDAKQHLRVDGNEQDAVIDRCIRVAREQAEAYQNRAYLEQILELVLERLPDMPVHLPRPPLVSLEAVTLTDEDGATTAVPITDFIVDTDSEPGRLFFKKGKSWPAVTLGEGGSLRIRYKAGLADAADVPARVLQAILVQTGYLFENREADTAGEGGSDAEMLFRNLLRTDRIVPL